MFLVLWVVAQLLAAVGLGTWAVRDLNVRNWIYSPQGFFVLVMLSLLLGPGIIIVMHRPKTTTGCLELFSLTQSFGEIKFRWLWLGIAIAAIVSVVPQTWVGAPHTLSNMFIRAHIQGGTSYVVAAMLLGPIPEEAILRGYLYRNFRNAYGMMISMVIVALLNVVLHIDSVLGSIVWACFFAGMGMLLCYILDSGHNLLDCIVFHIGYNATLAVSVLVALARAH